MNIKIKYLVTELVYLLFWVPYIVWLYYSNKIINKKYANQDIIQKSFNIITNDNTLAMSLLKWGAILILVGIAIITYHVFLNKNDYSDKSNNFRYFILLSILNVTSIIIILYMLANPILIAFTIVAGVCSGIIMGVS